MKLKYTTKETFTDITDDIKVPKNASFVHISSKHTTAGIRIMENEIALKRDMERFLDRVVPEDDYYAHDIIELRNVSPEERKNGFSHLRFLFFNTSELIPVKDSKLDLGKWQRVFLVELDPYREREVNINYI